MAHRIEVPESSIDKGNGYKLPKEEDLRTYIRLMHERSIPGQEVITQRDIDGDPAYDVVDFSKRNEPASIERFNLMRTFRDESVPLEHLGVPSGVVHEDTMKFWEGSKLVPFLPYWNSHQDILIQKTTKSWINSPRDARTIAYSVRSAIKRQVEHGYHKLKNCLEASGHLKVRGEYELLKEIELRQSQFPRSQVFALIGYTTRDFLVKVYGNRLTNAFPVPLFTWQRAESVGTAVLAADEIKTNQIFIWDYRLFRRPRYWELSTAIVSQMGMEVSPRQEKKEIIQVREQRKLEIE
jgi:hypothetical protein